MIDEGCKGLENAPRAKPLDIKGQCERQIKELQEACGEVISEEVQLLFRQIPACLPA